MWFGLGESGRAMGLGRRGLNVVVRRNRCADDHVNKLNGGQPLISLPIEDGDSEFVVRSNGENSGTTS